MSEKSSIHIPVLLDEVIKTLEPKKNQNFVDCTLGSGGHAEKILEKTSPRGKLLGIDLDEEAVNLSKEKLQKFEDRCFLVKNNFVNLEKILDKYKLIPIDGILIDLGVSTQQLQTPSKGFSFQIAGPLDMRYGKNQSKLNAEKLINEFNEQELVKIFKEYGEERFAKKIASKIVWTRKKEKIDTTLKLASLIKKIVPQKFYIKHTARIFQAIRIAINNELKNLSQVLPQAVNILRPGGRIAIITFHSLEDRIVKHFFIQETHGCICHPEIPVCKCNHKPRIKIITKKPILPSEKEIKENPKSRSAKLRVAEKI